MREKDWGWENTQFELLGTLDPATKREKKN